MYFASHGRAAFAVATCIALAVACAPDAGLAPGDKSALHPSWTVNPDPGEVAEQARLAGFARTLALTLGDDAVRLRLKNDLDGSHFREHKLHAARYLRGDAGKALRTRLASKMTRGDADIDATLNSIRSVELYMPVPEHKLTWDGGPDVIVGAQLREGAPVVGFRLDGSEVKLSVDSVPSTPTLVLVSVETDFDHPMSDAQVQAADKQLRARAALMSPTVGANMDKSPGVSATVVPCGDCDGGGGGDVNPPPSGPTGLYMEFSRLVDMGEPWTRGDPEIEVHIHGPTNAANSQYGEDLACAGEYGGPNRSFDQNSGFWNGSVLLYTKAQAEDFDSKFHEGFNVLFWEDDDTACTIKTDKDELRGALQAGAAAFGSVAVFLDAHANWAQKAGSFIGTLYTSADWLLSNDDYLGGLVLQSAVGQNFPDATHMIMKRTSINGRVRLVWK